MANQPTTPLWSGPINHWFSSIRPFYTLISEGGTLAGGWLISRNSADYFCSTQRIHVQYAIFTYNYIYPQESTIHVAKYTRQPWILWGSFIRNPVRFTTDSISTGWHSDRRFYPIKSPHHQRISVSIFTTPPKWHVFIYSWKNMLIHPIQINLLDMGSYSTWMVDLYGWF